MSIYIDDAMNPRAFFDTYEEAVAFAKPLAEQGTVAITTRDFDEEERNM